MSDPYFLYEQASGLFCGVDEQGCWFPIAEGYSGKPPYVNDPAAEDRKSLGPIPRGRYRTMPSIRHTRLGPVAIELVPQAGHPMFDRSGFWIHGDNRDRNRSASSGCIILGRDARELISRSPGLILHVVRGVDYAEDTADVMDGDCQGAEPLGAEQFYSGLA